MNISQSNINELEQKLLNEKEHKSLVRFRIIAIILTVLLLIEIGVFAYLVKIANETEVIIEEREQFDISQVSDKMAEVATLTTINEEMYLDRNRDLHLLCQVISTGDEYQIPLDVAGVDVWYKLYGDDTDVPWSVFSAYSDENGFVDVIVDFPGLTPADEQHVLGSVDNLVSYDIAALNGIPQQHSPEQHKGEASFACANWLTNSSWYKVDYRSWGSREMSATHTGHSPDPAVRERYTWVTHPQYTNSANADGTACYWNNLNWILVHDYSWMGQVWLTMSPGAIYYIDGVEYEALGVFNQDRRNTISVIYDRIGSREPLILQTCDGWIDVRIIYGKPTEQLAAEREAEAQAAAKIEEEKRAAEEAARTSTVNAMFTNISQTEQ